MKAAIVVLLVLWPILLPLAMFYIGVTNEAWVDLASDVALFLSRERR